MRTFRSLRHRNYRLYAGQMTSLIGSWTQITALTWLAHEYTHQAKWPAFLAAVQIGPTLILGPWGGALADRVSKRSLIIRTQFAFLSCALILLGLYAAGLLNEWVMLGVMFFHGIVQAIDLPARLAYVPGLVDKEDLSNAVALNSLLFNVARAIGPGLAGLLLSTAGAGLCFIVNALSYLAIILALYLIRTPPAEVGATLPTPAGGFRVLASRPGLLTLLLLAGIIAIGGWPLLPLLPSFADNVLGLGQKAYGTLLSSVGFGALCAALTAASIGNEVRRKIVMLGGLLVADVGMLGLGGYRAVLRSVLSTGSDLGLDELIQGNESSVSLLIASVCCVMFGYGMILFFATGQTVVHLGTSDADRGKVMGVWAMMLSAGVPIGNLVFGPTADALESVTTVIAIQAGLVALAVVILLTRRVE